MQEKHTYKVIVITVFFSSALISILSPMAIDIANAIPDIQQSEVLITVSAFLAVSAGFSIVWSLLDTRYDRKKLLIIATLDWTVFTFLSTFATDFISLLILQLCSAVGHGAILPLSYSTIVDLIDPENRGKAFGIKELFYITGIALSFLLSAFLVPRFPWQTPLYIISIAGILCLILLIRAKLPEKPELQEESEFISIKAFKQIIHNPAILIIIIFNFMLFFWYGAISQYYTTLLRNDYGFTPEMAFLFFVIYQIGQIPAGPIFGHIGDKKYETDKNGRIKVVLILVTCGALLNFIGFSIAISLDNILIFILFVIITSLAGTLFGGVDPLTQATLADVTTDTNRSTTYAINNLSYIFGRSISIFLLSIFLLMFNNLYRPGYVILSIGTLMAIIFLIPLLKVLPGQIDKTME
ncbi:MAG: MFS transporter [Promethearchaeota archaeon]|nr:MAG: MFS transporter [Candidatus Lokiarchaeota archaeon]